MSKFGRELTNLERIKAVVKWLIGSGVAENQAEVGKLLGYTNKSSFSQVINGKVPLPAEFTYRLAALDKRINEHWISEGWGQMLDESKASSIAKEGKIEVEEVRSKHNVIKYYDIDASAGPIEMFDPGNGTKYKDVVIPGFGDCEIALNVWGDSMEPVLNAGEIILCKEWPESFVEYGHIYLIVTRKNHRMIKYLKKSEVEGEVLCVSANDFYESFAIRMDDILKLYSVKGHIARNAF